MWCCHLLLLLQTFFVALLLRLSTLTFLLTGQDLKKKERKKDERFAHGKSINTCLKIDTLIRIPQKYIDRNRNGSFRDSIHVVLPSVAKYSNLNKKMTVPYLVAYLFFIAITKIN